MGRSQSARIVWKADPSCGRPEAASGWALPLPCSKRGARRAARRNADIYFHNAHRVTIVSSKAGAKKHPAWFHNLLANPDVVLGGIPMRAAVVGDEA